MAEGARESWGRWEVPWPGRCFPETNSPKTPVGEPTDPGPLAEAPIRKWEAVFSLLILGYRLGVTESSLFPRSQAVLKNCKIMNSTLFSIEGGGGGFQGAKPVRWVKRALFLKRPLPTIGTRHARVRVPSHKRSVGVRVSAAAAAGLAPGQGFQLERRGGV